MQKLLLSLLLMVAIQFTLSAQNTFNKKVLINGAASVINTFVLFPMSGEKILVDGSGNIVFDTSNKNHQLFYFIHDDEKSKLYNLKEEQLPGTEMDIIIPAKNFYDSLYKTQICPLCHKSDNVIPIVYGKPGKELVNQAQRGEVKLGGCAVSNTNPEFYCKTDALDF